MPMGRQSTADLLMIEVRRVAELAERAPGRRRQQAVKHAARRSRLRHDDEQREREHRAAGDAALRIGKVIS
jgi:hypothetical protein